MQNYTANVDTIKLSQKEETGWGRRQRKLEQENQVNERIYLCACRQGLLLISLDLGTPLLELLQCPVYGTHPSLLYEN